MTGYANEAFPLDLFMTLGMKWQTSYPSMGCCLKSIHWDIRADKETRSAVPIRPPAVYNITLLTRMNELLLVLYKKRNENLCKIEDTLTMICYLLLAIYKGERTFSFSKAFKKKKQDASIMQDVCSVY